MASKRPTILQIIPELETGGAELSTAEIAEAVIAAGGRAIVLAEPGGRLAARITESGGEVVPFPAATKNPAKIFANASKIAQMVKQEGVDLVHARSRAPAWSALMAARRAKVPFVTTYHGAYSEKGPIKRSYNSVMARGDRVIANSQYTSDLIQSRYGTAKDILRVIYRGVDEATYDPAAITPDRINATRGSWDIPANTHVILHPARLTSWKGQTVVIKAARKLKDAGQLDNVHIVFAGGDQGRTEYTQTLKDDIKECGLENHVSLVGHVEDMAAAYSTAFLTLIASTEPEAFGRTAAEAQAVHCPVIATRLGAPQETVLATPSTSAEQRTGWLVTPGDPEALATAITEALAQSEADRTALGQRARAHVMTNFTLANMRRRTLAVYDELLGPTFL